MREIYLLLFIFKFYLNSNCQSFPYDKHPPIAFSESIDLGSFNISPSSIQPKWVPGANAWSFELNVFNAFFNDFEIGINKYDYEPGVPPEINKNNPSYSIISGYGVFDLSKPFTSYKNFHSYDQKKVIFVTPSYRESIVVQCKKMTAYQYIEPLVDLVIKEAVDGLMDQYFPAKKMNKSLSLELRKKVHLSFTNYFQTYAGSKFTANALVELFNGFISNTGENGISKVLSTSMGIVLKELDPQGITITKEDAVKFMVDQAKSLISTGTLLNIFKKKLLSKSLGTIKMWTSLGELTIKSVDYYSNFDYNVVAKVYFKDLPPVFKSTNFNNNELRWDCEDSDNDVLEYDVFVKYQGKSNFEKLNSLPIKQKYFSLNQSLPEGNHEWYVTANYPLNYPLRINDIYKFIDPSSTKDKITSSTNTFNVGSSSSNQGSNSTLPKFTFESGTYKYIMKVNSLTLTHHSKYNKDYLSNRFTNISNKRTNNFRLFYGPASLTHSGVLNNNVVFLGHEIINNSNTLIGFFYDTKTKKQIDWCYITFLSNNQIKIKFRKDLEDQSGVYSILNN